jgi:hypothetical protein
MLHTAHLCLGLGLSLAVAASPSPASADWEALLKARVDRGSRSAHPASEPFARAVAPGAAGKWSVTDFGAAPDNSTDNTAAFAKALAACGVAGGGDVDVPVRRATHPPPLPSPPI